MTFFYYLEQLYQLYPPPTTDNTPYRTTVMQLERKNLSNLDFSNYHLDPKSKFTESNLENANFTQTKFGFDFDHQIDFSYAFLIGTRFPVDGNLT